jgi:hypothetical protein
MVIGVASLVDAAWSFQGVTLPYYANIQRHESNELPRRPLDKVEGFDWDGANVGHILRHAITLSKLKKQWAAPTSLFQRVPFMARIAGSFLAERHAAAIWSLFSRCAGSCFAPSLPTK